MKVAEATGHAAVITLFSSLGLLGLAGVLVGIMLFIGWVIYERGQ